MSSGEACDELADFGLEVALVPEIMVSCFDVERVVKV